MVPGYLVTPESFRALYDDSPTYGINFNLCHHIPFTWYLTRIWVV